MMISGIPLKSMLAMAGAGATYSDVAGSNTFAGLVNKISPRWLKIWNTLVSSGTMISGKPSPSRSPAASEPHGRARPPVALAPALLQSLTTGAPSLQYAPAASAYEAAGVAGRAGLPQSAKKSCPLFGPPPCTARTMPSVSRLSSVWLMNRISGKSRSSARPSPLSSSRFTTSGGETTCDDHGKALPAASSFVESAALYECLVPSPQRNSTAGSTSWNGVAGNVQVGATPVPTHAPASHVMNGGQSQSSSHVQAPQPAASAAHWLMK